jgi:hypothetical protein
MRYGVFHRSSLVVLAVLSMGLLGWPASTGAQIVGGITVGATTTTLLDTGTLAAGTVDALDASTTAASIGSVLTADTPSAAVIGYADEIDSMASLGGLNLTVGGVSITADSVVAQVMTPLGLPGFGVSYIDNLSVNGVAVSVNGSVNQTVAIPGGQIVLNQQQVQADGTTVVIALHATVFGVADVKVASATAGAGGGDALAAQATY